MNLYGEILLGIILILTMWQLAVTLSQIVDLIGKERARMRNIVGKIVAVVAAVAFALLELVLPFLIDEDLF